MNNTNSGNNTIHTSKTMIAATVFILIIIFTIFGNILVLVAIKREKQLQTKFNAYIVNLAITDLTVAVTAMTFYTTNNILGYWPFGKILCGVWIFNDYGMTFASVFTIIVISIDRFWAVTWPTHYRNNHTKKKCLLFIAGTWIFMVILWLPACIVDRMRANTDDDETICIWNPALNRKYVVVISTVGHHGSFSVILFCYVRVFYMLRKRIGYARKIRPKNLTANNLSIIEPSHFDTRSTFIPEQRHEPVVHEIGKGKQEVDRQCSSELNPNADNNIPSSPPQNAQDDLKNIKQLTKKDRRAFVTLTYIIICYVVCWFPFHVVFDISAISPDSVPDTAYMITFWMTYLNSTINPFLYNFSNPEFRRAFKKILLRR